MKRRKNVRAKLNKALEVPEELTLQVPRLTILEFKELLIENYKGILEYQDFFIRIKTNIGIININGYNLSLEEMTTDDLHINGNIESVDFESTEENGDV